MRALLLLAWPLAVMAQPVTMPKIELKTLPEQVQPLPPLVQPATGAEMTKLDNALRKSPLGADRLRVLRDATSLLHFTAAQALTLAKRVHDGPDRVDALVMLSPRVVDPKNFHTAWFLLARPDDRLALSTRLAPQP